MLVNVIIFDNDINLFRKKKKKKKKKTIDIMYSVKIFYI